MKTGAHAVDGRGRPTEDRWIVKPLSGGRAIVAVFDGHSGLFTVVRTVATLPDKLAAMWDRVGDDEVALRAGLKQVFLDHDKSLAAEGPLRYRESGSTATVALVGPKTVVFAFVGDSPGFVMDPATGRLLADLRKHEPMQPDEHRRILANGGSVSQDPGDAPRVNGSLMVSRAFGDFSLKFADGHVPEFDKDWAGDFCVTADPEVVVVPRPERGLLAIMSDGLVESVGDALKPTSDVAMSIRDALHVKRGLEEAAKEVIHRHMMESALTAADYDGDDLTLVLMDVSAPLPEPVAAVTAKPGVLTRRARGRRTKTGKKRLPKTFQI
jgi:serine/threonine protein phosphatase PrpC